MEQAPDNQNTNVYDAFAGREIDISRTPIEKPVEIKSSESNTKKSGFWADLKEILGSDIIWLSIGVSLILCVALFYLQVLQPLFLNTYADKNLSKAQDITSSYTQKSNGFVELNAQMKSRFDSYSRQEICSDTQKYTSKSEDSEALQKYLKDLEPDTSLQTSPQYRMFSETSIKQEYQKIYSIYSSSLQNQKTYATELNSIIAFLEARNSWIDMCEQLQSEPVTTNTISSVCIDLTNKVRTINASSQGVIWKDLKSSLEDTIVVCSNNSVSIPASQLTATRIALINAFDRIMSYKPDFDSLEKRHSQTSSDFASKMQSSIQVINSTVNSKSQFENMFYLLDIKLS